MLRPARSSLAALVFGALVALSPSASAQEDSLPRARLEALLHDRDPLLVEQTFRRHAGDVLPFIDGYLEEALGRIEKGEPEAALVPMFDTAVAFAKLASSAFSDDTIARYAASYASWTDAERIAFREGQKAFREGRALEKKEDHEGALERHRASLRHAEALEDTWGEVMALGGIARCERTLGRTVEAVRQARRGAEFARRLRLERTEAELLLLCGEVLSGNDDMRGALPNLFRAWSIVEPMGDDALRARIRDLYIACLEKVGQTRDADEVRRQGGLPVDRGGDDEK